MLAGKVSKQNLFFHKFFSVFYRRRMSYDRALTVFSPDGHLFQVEYAMEAVKKGAAAVRAALFLFFFFSFPPFSIPLALGFLLFSSNYTHNPFHSFVVQIAVRGESVIVIGVEKRTIPTLQDPRTIRKIIQLDENICFTFSGIISVLFFFPFLLSLYLLKILLIIICSRFLPF